MRHTRGCAPQPKSYPKVTQYAVALEELGRIMPTQEFGRMMGHLITGDLTLPEKVAFTHMMQFIYRD